MSDAPTKRCPVCNASNPASALFCEECGSSIATVGAATQITGTMSPVDTTDETVSVPIAVAPPTPAQSSAPIYSAPIQSVSTEYGYVPQNESVRGAVLGWVAMVLMLLIVGFFVWSTLISDTLRDRLTGWF